MQGKPIQGKWKCLREKQRGGGAPPIRLTMDLYTHTVLDEQSAALDKLPDLDAAEPGSDRAARAEM